MKNVIQTKESEEVSVLIWTDFDSFAITFSTSGSAQIFANAKGPRTSFLVGVFVKIFDKIFSFVI